MSGLVNTQSLGWLVAGVLDANDPKGQAYDEVSLAKLLLSGAQYTWTANAKGVPVLTRVASTGGPIYGLFPWPGKSPRKLAQLSFVFAAKITTASPLKATPVKSGNGSGWTAATDLDEVSVFTSDGSAPAVGTFGVVVIGTDLHNQTPLFFQGGGGSATIKCFKVTLNNANGTYEGVEYDEPGGSVIGDPLHPTPLKEDNLAPDVPVNQWVRGVPGVSTATTSVGDTDVPVFWFSMPFGCFA